MKWFLILTLVFMMSCTEEKGTASNNHSEVKQEVTKSDSGQMDELEEDCDDKFEKSKEKEIDEENLFGQNSKDDEGCTIE